MSNIDFKKPICPVTGCWKELSFEPRKEGGFYHICPMHGRIGVSSEIEESNCLNCQHFEMVATDDLSEDYCHLLETTLGERKTDCVGYDPIPRIPKHGDLSFQDVL